MCSLWLKDVWGVPEAAGGVEGSQPVKDTVKTMVGMAQPAAYQAFLTDRQRRQTHHPKGQLHSITAVFWWNLPRHSWGGPTCVVVS